MCGCPTHVVEAASQLASSAAGFGPLAGVVSAALVGGKFGQLLLRLRASFFR